jgi:hypothetical protein
MKKWRLRSRKSRLTALTSPTSGGRSVGILRLRTKAMEFSFLVLVYGNHVTKYNCILDTFGKTTVRKLGIQTQSVNFLQIHPDGPTDIIFIRSSATKNGLTSNNWFRLQLNVLRVSRVWELCAMICSRFCYLPSSQILAGTPLSMRWVSSVSVSATHGGHVALPGTKFCLRFSWLVWTRRCPEARGSPCASYLQLQSALQELMEWAWKE